MNETYRRSLSAAPLESHISTDFDIDGGGVGVIYK